MNVTAAILIVLVIVTMAALLALAIPDMWRGLRGHWRETRQAARDHAPDRPGERDALDALINAVVCTWCRPGGWGACICGDRKCEAPLCPAPDTGVVVFTRRDRRLLRRAGIKDSK